jgi:hypothetical protein
MKIGVGIDGTADERTLWANDDNRKACVATPAKTLEDRIMNPCVAKTEAEWWAAVALAIWAFDQHAQRRRKARGLSRQH